MKILKENKETASVETLPIEFITTFVSDCWTKIGDLRSQLDGIKEVFTNTEGIEPILSDLIDTYLVCVGRAETLLYADKIIEEPLEFDLHDTNTTEIENTVAAPVVTAEPAEQANIEPNMEIISKPAAKMTSNEVDFDSFEPDQFFNIDKPKNTKFEEFEYFTDFEEPVGDKLTDSDLYDEDLKQ